MAREQRGASPRAVVLLLGLAGALVVTLVLGLTRGGQVTTHAAAAARPLHSVTFIGDSWTFGEGATPLHGYAYLTGEQLGWTYQVLGVRGSGYTVPGVGGGPFGTRVDRAAATHPDVIVVQGSLNDRAGTVQSLTAAADATLARLRAEAGPRTRILVVGASYTPGMPDATIDWINGAIEGAAARSGLEFVNPAAENWTDPHDPSIWHDVFHPNDTGYQLVADHLEPLLRALVSDSAKS